jgi:hypothetical protein
MDSLVLVQRKSTPPAREKWPVIRVPILKSLTSLKLASKDGVVMQSTVLHLPAAVST